MLRTHAITVYCIAKVVNFPQSATTYLYWSRAAEPIAEKRHEGGVYGRIVSPRVFRAWGFAAWLRGSKKQAASRKGKPLVLCLLSERLLAQGSYAHIGFACAFLAEFDGAVYKGEERVVFTDTHVFTGVVNRAALTNDNVARLSELATE